MSMNEKTERRIISIIFIICIIPLFTAIAYSQQKREIELGAQEIIARVDKVLEYPRGLIRGKLMHIQPDGNSSIINLQGNIGENDSLFIFSNTDRGEQLKVLYNLKGEDIWVYNIHAIKLFHKMDIDKYDPVLMTNFYYIDLSNAAYQSNYNGTIIGDAVVKGYDTYKLRLDPIYKGGNYGVLTLYASKKDFIPIRIDFHDNDKVIFKSLSVVKTIARNNRIIPVRYDMLDIRRGTVTILEFFGFDDSVVFDKSIFFHQRLGEKG